MQKVQTVLGPIDADDLGITVTHEHLFVDFRNWFVEPEQSSDREMARQPVSLENIS